MNRHPCFAFAALALASCATSPGAAPTAVAPVAARMTQSEAHDALFALFKASDEASL